MLYGIASATIALLLAAVLAALFRVPALRLGLVDRRRQRPVPLSGGVAVVLVSCLVMVAGDWLGAAPLDDEVRDLLVAGAAIAVLGLVADVWRLKARFLVVGTAVAAAWVVPYADLGVPGGALAACWVTFVALAFRSLDHADGLAGTVGVLTAFGVAACAAVEVMDGLAGLLSVLAAALTGFLMHNWPPARVALGGCGALFAGFLLAAVAVTVRAGHGFAVNAGVLFALTAIAGADVVLVALSRRIGGRPLLRRAPDHLGHRLRRLGLTGQGAAVLLGVAAFTGVVVAVLVHLGWVGAQALWWVAGVTPVVVVGLTRVPVGPPRTRVSVGSPRTRVPVGPRGSDRPPRGSVAAPRGRRQGVSTQVSGQVSGQVAGQVASRMARQTEARAETQRETQRETQAATRTSAQTSTRTSTRTSTQTETHTSAGMSTQASTQASPQVSPHSAPPCV